MSQSEITFIVTYECPRCHAALEARTSESYTWLRCPKCGRASLPPEHMRRLPQERAPLDEDVLVIGPMSNDPRMAAALPSLGGASPASISRVLLAVGVLGALTMLVLSILDHDVGNVTVFGIATIVLFVLLASVARRR